MRVAVRKWGNSLALRIPKSLAQDSGIESGSLVDLIAQDGHLLVRPVSASATLESLLAAITDDNRHDEVATGQPVGREAW